jgi:hypothetical protein
MTQQNSAFWLANQVAGCGCALVVLGIAVLTALAFISTLIY